MGHVTLGVGPPQSTTRTSNIRAGSVASMHKASGTAPLSALEPRSTSSSVEIRPNCVGIGPVNRLEERLRNSSTVKRPISVGIVPVSGALVPRSSRRSKVRRPISVGSEPDKKLFPMAMVSSSDSCPIRVGSVPKKRFPPSSRYFKNARPKSSDGKLPDNPLLLERLRVSANKGNEYVFETSQRT
jgi:hypothetical protein